MLKSRFKARENFDHELSVNLVLPGVKYFFVGKMAWRNFWDCEVTFLEIVDKITEQKLLVKFILNILRQFIQQLLIFLTEESQILFVVPEVLKVVLYFLF